MISIKPGQVRPAIMDELKMELIQRRHIAGKDLLPAPVHIALRHVKDKAIHHRGIAPNRTLRLQIWREDLDFKMSGGIVTCGGQE
jgi:hypothetical protein